MENQAYEGPQDFELVELLFKDVTAIQNRPGPNSSNSPQNQEPFDSFKSRFQSFINQIPSYLHSSEKEGFFSHFFLGTFATLLDTKLNTDKLKVKQIWYSFSNSKTLKVATTTASGKVNFFIFSEVDEKNPTESIIDFYSDEWKEVKIKMGLSSNIKPDIKLIKIEKGKDKTSKRKKIIVEVENKEIHTSALSVPSHSFKEITKKLSTGCLEDYITQLANPRKDLVNTNLKSLLTDVQRIHKDLNLLDGVYGERAREANQHGFLAGVLDNFRYRYNAKIYLEQFAGRGYADIVLLVRSPGRIINAIPIIIELKAGKDEKKVTTERKRKAYEMKIAPGVTPTDARTQSEGYAEGFQPNKLRVLTLAKYIICAGINFDFPTLTSVKTSSVPIVKPQRPLIGRLLESVKRFGNGNIDKNNLNKEMKFSISREYYTFPPTPEKSNDFYFSRFLLGQVIPIDNDDFERYVFIHGEMTLKDKQATTSSKPMRLASQEAMKKITRLQRSCNNDQKHEITTIMLIPKEEQHAILLNIIENHEGDFLKINLESIANQLANKKIIELNVWFNTSQKPNSKGNKFENYLTIKDMNSYNSSQDYISNTANHNRTYNGEFKQISCPVSFQETFDTAIVFQKNHLNDQPVFSSHAYKDLFEKIGEGIFHFKGLIKGETSVLEYNDEEPIIISYENKYEALIQAVLHGLFNHYSDSKLIEYPENIELVATEFQTGAGSRIDMMIQGIGNTPQGIREYVPVGIELKWGELNETQKIELTNQMKRYAEEGFAIKAITDSPRVVIMGIDFDDRKQDPKALFLLVDPISGLVTHSSIRVFPVLKLSHEISSILDSTPSQIVSNINVILPPRQQGPNLGPSNL